MAHSPLSTEVWNTSQYSARTRAPAGVVLHHGATTSADAIISMEVSGSRQVSSHQVVKDKRNAGIVQEQFRAWSLSDAYWDSWAFTVECANESTDGWTISDASHETLAQQVADWAARYGFWPHRDGAANTWTVIGHREVYSIHGGSYATACPGGMNLDFIAKRAQQILAGGSIEQKDKTMYLIHHIVGKDQAIYLASDTSGLTPVGGIGNLDVLKAVYGEPKVVNTTGNTVGLTPIQNAIAWNVKNFPTGSGGSGGDSATKIAAAVEATLKDDFAQNAKDSGAAARAAIVK